MPIESDFNIASQYSGGKVDDIVSRITAISSLALDSSNNIVASGVIGFSGSLLKVGIMRFTSAGVLDTSFNSTGYNNTEGGYFGTTWAYGVAIQSDGKIVAESTQGMTRYNTDGSIDTSFAGGTSAATGFGVAIQPNGKIVAGGANASTKVRAWRVTTGGGSDSGFGATGVATDSSVLAPSVSFPYSPPSQDVAIASNGDILVAGQSSIVAFTSVGGIDSSFGSSGVLSTSLTNISIIADGSDFIIAGQSSGGYFAAEKITASGSLVGGFGTSGVETTSFTGTPNAIAIDSSGNIVLAGTNSSDFAIVRLTPTGGVDTSFNTTGEQTTDFSGGDDGADAVVITSGGDIIAGGYEWSSGLIYAALAEYDSTGALVSGFGTSGKATVTSGLLDVITSMTLDASGNIIAEGDWGLVGAEAMRVGVARFTPTGSLDTTFNGTGVNNTLYGWMGSTFAGGVALEPDGKILGESTFGITRYNPDGTIDSTFGSSGTQALSSINLFGLTLQPDGKIVVAGADSGGHVTAWRLGGVTRLFAQHDANYNITALTNTSGVVVQRMIYGPYGTETVLQTNWIAPSAAIYSAPYGFQGGRIDPASGMVHFGAREYDAVLGRWVQEDPAGYIDSFNLFQFELASPLSAIDPAGTESVPLKDHYTLTIHVKVIWVSEPPSENGTNAVGATDSTGIGVESVDTDYPKNADCTKRTWAVNKLNIEMQMRIRILSPDISFRDTNGHGWPQVGGWRKVAYHEYLHVLQAQAAIQKYLDKESIDLSTDTWYKIDKYSDTELNNKALESMKLRFVEDIPPDFPNFILNAESHPPGFAEQVEKEWQSGLPATFTNPPKGTDKGPGAAPPAATQPSTQPATQPTSSIIFD